MSNFKLLNTNRFYLKGTRQQWLHLATVTSGLHEYMCFVDLVHQQVYIEQITGGHLERIEDDALAEGLHNYLVEQKVLDVGKPTVPDQIWYNLGK